jgi:hypothetical protein
MSRTVTQIRGKEFPKGRKTKRVSTPKDAPKDKFKKDFGFTSGTHSQFDNAPEKYKKGRTYPIKGEDYIKYGYGNGTAKTKRVKNYKKEID